MTDGPGTGLRRVAVYCRVSTTGQTAENQLLALRSFAAARGWVIIEYVDQGQSGAKERRPALDALLAAARARTVDVVACVKLDRLARSVHHLVAMVREFEVLGVDLVVLDQAIDTTTPAGRLLFHVLAAISEFERDLIRDRVLAGLRRVRAQERGWAGRARCSTGSGLGSSSRPGNRCARSPEPLGSRTRRWPGLLQKPRLTPALQVGVKPHKREVVGAGAEPHVSETLGRASQGDAMK